MNKFVVFAILAVCAFAHPMFPSLEYHRNRGVRGDEVVMKPHDLPCAYEISFSQVAQIQEYQFPLGNASGSYFAHGTYFKIAAEGNSQMLQRISKFEKLYRTDLKGQGNDTIVMVMANNSLGVDVCANHEMTMEQMRAEFKNTLILFVNETTHQKKEKGTFNGKECTVFIDEDEDSVSKLYLDADNYLIGAEYIKAVDMGSVSSSVAPASSSSVAPASSSSESASSSSSHTNPDADDIVHVSMVATIKYKFEASLDKFVITKDISGKCSEQVYKAPTEKLCDEPSQSSSMGSNSMATTTKAAAILTLLSVAFIALL